MLVVVQHTLTESSDRLRTRRAPAAWRGSSGRHACAAVPSQADGKLVTCLWESDSVDDVQSYVDETLGDSSVNLCYAVEETAAFAEPPQGISAPPVSAAA